MRLPTFHVDRNQMSSTTCTDGSGTATAYSGQVSGRSRVWNRTDLEALRQLPAWAAVEGALQGDENLRAQLDTLVGTARGASPGLS
jgi:hypothetical protein